MAHLLLSPLTWALVLLALLAVPAIRRHRHVRWAGLAALGTCALLATPLGANTLVAWLEHHAPDSPPCRVPDDAPIVVLGGGFAATPRSVNDVTSLTLPSQRRIAAVAEVAARSPNAAVIVSGGQTSVLPEAQVAATLARQLGVAPERLRLEAASLNTRQNATAVAALLPPGTDHVQLLTSAWHMARAERAFAAAGVATCRHVADSDYIAYTGLGYLVPQSSALAKVERAIHELVGLAALRLRP